MKQAKKFIFLILTIVLLIAFALVCLARLRVRKELKLTFDADYYWAEKAYDDSIWFYEKVPAGFEYYLYIPPEFRNDRHNAGAKLPLIIAFHGSSSKYVSRGNFGRMLISPKLQNVQKSAVLVLLSRGQYYSNYQDTSLLIQNLLMKNECIDRKNIIGFGHSQGAEFVVKLACFEPALFKAVISGSGYYQPSLRELLNVMPIRFYWKISKYDKGIYEQGYKTGRLFKKFCKDSVNIELESREHCWVEVNDVIPDSNRTFLDWYKSAVTEP